MTIELIKSILDNSIITIKEKFDVKKIGIFGSFARNEQTDSSDVDIVVEFEKTPGLIRFIQLEEYLEELFNRKVDLVTFKSINKKIEEQILKEVIFI